MLHNPINPPAWPHYPQPHSHGASPSSRARHVARWHPYDSGNGANGTTTVAGTNGLGDKLDCSPKRRLHITIPTKCVRTRSLTDIHASGALAPSPLRNCVIEDARAGQICEAHESAHLPGAMPALTRQYTLPTLQTPSRVKPQVLRSIMTTPSTGFNTPTSSFAPSSATGYSTPTSALDTPTTIHPSRMMVTPASAISPISPVRERGFPAPMTHGRPMTAAGEVAARAGGQKIAMDGNIGFLEGKGGQEGTGFGLGRREDDEDARTEVGSPEMEVEEGIQLPPIRMLPKPILSGSVAQQTRRAMQSGAVPHDVLLYGPAGVTPAPAELARNNACDKLPPVPAFVAPRQATFFGIQNVPVADGSSRFATMCAPVRPSSRPVYPPAGLAPLVAGHQGLPHGGLTAPIERADEVAEWKELQRAKERADIVVKDGDLTAAERVEMEKRVSMSVKVINHIYYGADDLPQTRSPTQVAQTLLDDDEAPAASTSTAPRPSTGGDYWPPTPASMPSSPEDSRTRRERQRASMRKDVLGESTRAPKRKETELEAMVRTIEEAEESDPTRDQPTRTLTWFVTEVLRRSRTSINVLQVALAYLAGAKPEIHKELRAAADRQAELAMQIAGLPQHVRDILPNMDWLGSEFTPSPLIDPRRTFLASLVLASKFLLDKAFSNKAWAKLSGLEALEVGKCERALGMALNWRLWVGREVAPQPSPAPFDQPPVQPQLVHSPPTYPSTIRPSAWEKSLAHVVVQQNSPARSISPSHGSVFTTSSTPTLYSGSELGSEPDMPQGYEEVSNWTQTPELYVDINEPMVAVGGDMLHGSPEGSSRAATGGSMHCASDTAASSRPVLPSIRSFDRPPLRRGPSELVTPQTDSNMGCGHMPQLCVEYPNESPLAYASLDRPWNAVNGHHWDFATDGVVGA